MVRAVVLFVWWGFGLAGAGLGLRWFGGLAIWRFGGFGVCGLGAGLVA